MSACQTAELPADDSPYTTTLESHDGDQLSYQSFTIPYGHVVTDTIIWVSTVDSLNLGDGSCGVELSRSHIGYANGFWISYGLWHETVYTHEWIYSEPWYAGSWQTCLVGHNGFHCDLRDKMRNRICRKCLRKETQREKWIQHRYVPEKSEYELLEEKMNRE